MMTLPNILTLFRILGSFVYLYYGALQDWHTATLIFLASAVTDLVDGALARILKQRTQLGAFLDPMADKLLMFFSFMTLTASGFLPVYLTVLVVARDLFIAFGIRYLISQKADMKYRPTFLSKTTTCFQIGTILIALILTQKNYLPWVVTHLRLSTQALEGVCVMTAALTVVTFYQYYQIGFAILRETKFLKRAA